MVITITDWQVNVIDWVATSAVAPFMSCVLFTNTVVENSGFVAEVTALVCFSVRATVEPQAACRVAFTLAEAASLRKSKVIVLASKPLTNL